MRNRNSNVILEGLEVIKEAQEGIVWIKSIFKKGKFYTDGVKEVFLGKKTEADLGKMTEYGQRLVDEVNDMIKDRNKGANLGEMSKFLEIGFGALLDIKDRTKVYVFLGMFADGGIKYSEDDNAFKFKITFAKSGGK